MCSVPADISAWPCLAGRAGGGQMITAESLECFPRALPPGPCLGSSLGPGGSTALGVCLGSPSPLGFWLIPPPASVKRSPTPQAVLSDRTQGSPIHAFLHNPHLQPQGSSPSRALPQSIRASQLWIRHRCSVSLQLGFSPAGRGTYSMTGALSKEIASPVSS